MHYILNKKLAFTLVEVMITIAVTGVVAAITLPVVINKINDIQYDRARERVLNTVGEAGRLIAVEGNMTSATDAKDFVENYLSKKLKIIKTCEATNLASLEKCGLPRKIKTLDGNSEINMPTTMGPMYSNMVKQSYEFMIANGYSINLYYNPNCLSTSVYGRNYDEVCVNVIYDMNGLHTPNQLGKDIGIVTILHPDETGIAIAPNPAPSNAGVANWNDAWNLCKEQDKSYTLPNKNEMISMAFNNGTLIKINGIEYWSATENNSTKAYTQSFHPFGIGQQIARSKTSKFNVRCVKR